MTDHVFLRRMKDAGPNGRRHDARLVEAWVDGVGLRREDYGTHPLRRTKAAMFDKQTGDLRMVQILLGHTQIESTVPDLDIDVEDAPVLAERTGI